MENQPFRVVQLKGGSKKIINESLKGEITASNHEEGAIFIINLKMADTQETN